jgi:hypothetical protein
MGRLQGKRPKSREETPKEGSGNQTIAAPQQYESAPPRAQGLLSDLPCKSRMPDQ